MGGVYHSKWEHSMELGVWLTSTPLALLLQEAQLSPALEYLWWPLFLIDVAVFGIA